MDIQTKTRVHGHSPALFCCSNIYVEKGTLYQAKKKYNLAFSCCDQGILQSVYEGLLLHKTRHFGDNEITIQSVKIGPDEKVRAGKVLSAKTPIVISLDDYTGSRYGIEVLKKPTYRVKEHGFEVRVRQLHKNILRKYVLLIKQGYLMRLTEWDKELVLLYDNEDKLLFDVFCSQCNFFSGYKYRRNAVAQYKEGFVGGSVRDLVVADDIHGVRVLKHVLPIGIGERCTTGFGRIK